MELIPPLGSHRAGPPFGRSCLKIVHADLILSADSLSGLRVFAVVQVVSGLGGANAGGVQETGRLAWEALCGYADRSGEGAALLCYGDAGELVPRPKSARVATARSRCGV